jgi:hypothetical protein
VELVYYGAGCVVICWFFLRTISRYGVMRQVQRDAERHLLEDLRRIRVEQTPEEQRWKEELQFWTERDQKLREQMGQRVLPLREPVPVLRKPPPPPPPASGARPKPAEPVCAHLFRVPVTDALGTELASICLHCDSQITNEEFVKVGW